MSLSTENAQIMKITGLISAYELRLMMISATKNLKHANSSAETSSITFEMQAQIDAVKAKYGNDENAAKMASEDYRQMMSEIESVENEYQTILDSIRDQMEAVEEKLDLMKETTETQLEVLRSELDEWKKARDNTTENFAPDWD